MDCHVDASAISLETWWTFGEGGKSGGGHVGLAYVLGGGYKRISRPISFILPFQIASFAFWFT